MGDTKKNTLSLSVSAEAKKDLLTTVGKIRQSFSHGKSKVVAVEVKKKRFIGNRPNDKKTTTEEAYSGDLTKQEMQTRMQVVKDAIRENRKKEEQQKREEAERIRLEQLRQEELRKLEEDATRQKKVAEKTEVADKKSNKTEKKSDRKPEKTENKIASQKNSDKSSGNRTIRDISGFAEVKESHSKVMPKKNSNHYSKDGESLNDDDAFTKSGNVNKRTLTVKKDIKELKGKYKNPSAGRLSIYNALDADDEERTRSLSSLRRARQKVKQAAKVLDDIKVVKEVILPESISVQELSNRMAVRTGEVVKSLMKSGMMVTANQLIDADTAEIIVLEFGHKVKRISDSYVELGLKKVDSEKDLLPRPPVVTIMGHVDHGKTSLLDALRRTDVALNEAGGITQGIGAYQVTLKDNRKITFIDTPGHAAFTEMRSRGANVTDVVVLVVAADDSVKDQTVEAINHAKAAGVPIIVAINKMDKPGANSDKVRKDLMNYEVFVESYGGDVMDVEISAKSGLNLDKLEDAILLQAEMLELKANPNRIADGVVIESKVEKGLGPVATVLIRSGTLKVGDIFVSGVVFGKVRAIRNDCGQKLKELTPATPGEIIGFDGTTIPGDDFVVVENETKAREIAGYRERKKREQAWVVSSKTSVEQMFSQLSEEQNRKVLSVIVKADVQGSAEAICSSLLKLSNEEVAVKIIHSGIGEITENDIVLAKASNAVVLGFNVRSNMQAKDLISRNNIQVMYYSIIYDLIDNIKALLSGMLTPDTKENVLGSAEVRKIFDISKFGKIAGCMVIDGIVKKGAKLRLIRDGIVVHTGNIKSVRREKDDVKEVHSGFECGIMLENYSDIHLKDIIECFEIEEVARQL